MAYKQKYNKSSFPFKSDGPKMPINHPVKPDGPKMPINHPVKPPKDNRVDYLSQRSYWKGTVLHVPTKKNPFPKPDED